MQRKCAVCALLIPDIIYVLYFITVRKIQTRNGSKEVNRTVLETGIKHLAQIEIKETVNCITFAFMFLSCLPDSQNNVKALL